MVVLKTQSEFGRSPPPETPYNIVSNLPGWDLMERVLGGDPSPLAGVVHIYPRFAPTQFAAQLGQAIAKKVEGMDGKRCMVYLNPVMIPYTLHHVTLERRKQHIMKPEDLTWKAFDIAGHRLYAVFFDPRKTPGIIVSWSQPGLGISLRGAEGLLEGVEAMKEVVMEGIASPPKPTFTPESWAHAGLRERINELLHRAAIDPAQVTCEPKDVFLYPTGMAAVYLATNLLLEHRPGTAVILGVVFHNTYHHLLEESPHGFKHAGKVDKDSIDQMEVWLEEEKEAKRPVSFVIAEVPGNPTLDTPDFPRLKNLSEKYGFVLIVDDTVGSFANIDVLSSSDILLSSLTKSFSGYANVLGGSIVLNPLSPHYTTLSPAFTKTHTNELFAADASVLLANSQDLLSRTRRLNRNAAALASFFHQQSLLPNSPITDVQYPSLLPTKSNYDRHLRRSTPDLPEPGYGCILTVNFSSTEKTKAFYDRCGFYPSPHLGAHVTIILAYNMGFAKEKEEEDAYRKFGVKKESVRISAGLENVEDLIDTVKDALDFAGKSSGEEGNTGK